MIWIRSFFFTSGFANRTFTFPSKNYSADQLVDIGCQWLFLDTERRHIIGEDDEMIIFCAYATGLTLPET